MELRKCVSVLELHYYLLLLATSTMRADIDFVRYEGEPLRDV